MPIYEYECPQCGLFEAVQKASEAPLKAKPDCDSKQCPKKAKRLISASAFHLKGGGWYKTDYAPKASKSSQTSDNGSGETTAAKSESAAPAAKEGASSSTTEKAGAETVKSPAKSESAGGESK